VNEVIKEGQVYAMTKSFPYMGALQRIHLDSNCIQDQFLAVILRNVNSYVHCFREFTYRGQSNEIGTLAAE